MVEARSIPLAPSRLWLSSCRPIRIQHQHPRPMFRATINVSRDANLDTKWCLRTKTPFAHLTSETTNRPIQALSGTFHGVRSNSKSCTVVVMNGTSKGRSLTCEHLSPHRCQSNGGPAPW